VERGREGGYGKLLTGGDGWEDYWFCRSLGLSIMEWPGGRGDGDVVSVRRVGEGRLVPGFLERRLVGLDAGFVAVGGRDRVVSWSGRRVAIDAALAYSLVRRRSDVAVRALWAWTVIVVTMFVSTRR